MVMPRTSDDHSLANSSYDASASASGVFGLWSVMCGLVDVVCGLRHVVSRLRYPLCGMWYVGCVCGPLYVFYVVCG